MINLISIVYNFIVTDDDSFNDNMLKYKIKIRIVKENYHLPFGNHPQDEFEVGISIFIICLRFIIL